MEGWGVGVLGLLIGMQHALEADHLAAMATLFTDKAGRWQMVKRGIYWGGGHTAALLVMCSLVLLLDVNFTPALEAGLELFVGIMVLALGLNLAFTIKRKRIHAHKHKHGQELQHLHIHSHEMDESHNHERYHQPVVAQPVNQQPGSNLLKPFGIGLVHGAAGSGALLLVLAASANTLVGAYTYVGLFGFGSIAGMALLSLVVSYPLTVLGRQPGKMFNAAMISVSACAVSVGSYLVLISGATLAQVY